MGARVIYKVRRVEMFLSGEQDRAISIKWGRRMVVLRVNLSGGVVCLRV